MIKAKFLTIPLEVAEYKKYNEYDKVRFMVFKSPGGARDYYVDVTLGLFFVHLFRYDSSLEDFLGEFLRQVRVDNKVNTAIRRGECFDQFTFQTSPST
jgi:hypothetical protein